ncbi:hypothetical protein FNV43_RR15054 [Rhamnella rubrinervis]|uniref:Zinc knuckle CX2CX4HX4C domain-containing protein n=1 Tax=Rhamnella rubrinervis TaxID=2594499 RepID=A0A8K0E5Q2_9ROSA|nr:hypothetical protein FNV43_RR15054 [Rhamnella rubrinervis]
MSLIRSRFIRFQVDISVREPIPAGFFQSRENVEEFWIQFKYECLLDFCYTCGMIDHVTGRCTFRNPAFITAKNGVTAKLYGVWLRAESGESLKFMSVATPMEKKEYRRWLQTPEEDDRFGLCNKTNERLPSSAIICKPRARGDIDNIEEGQLVRDYSTCPTIEDLCYTMSKHLEEGFCFKSAIIQQSLEGNLNLEEVENWAVSWKRVGAQLEGGKERAGLFNVDSSRVELENNVNELTETEEARNCSTYRMREWKRDARRSGRGSSRGDEEAYPDRGIGRGATIRNLKDLIRSHRPQIVFLMETKSNKEMSSKLSKSLNYNHNIIVEFITGKNGVTAKLYGVWLRAESGESLKFMSVATPMEKKEYRSWLQTPEEDDRFGLCNKTNERMPSSAIICKPRARGDIDNIEEGQLVRDYSTCPTIEDLCYTMSKHLEEGLCFKSAIIQQSLEGNLNLEEVENWAEIELVGRHEEDDRFGLCNKTNERLPSSAIICKPRARGDIDNIEEGQLVRDYSTCPTIEDLCYTMSKHLEEGLCFKSAIIQQSLEGNLNLEEVENWAVSWLAQIAELTAHEDNGLERALLECQSDRLRNLGRELMRWTGLVPGTFQPASGKKRYPIIPTNLEHRKRVGAQLEGGERSGIVQCRLFEVEMENNVNELTETEEASFDGSNPVVSSVGRSPISPIRTRAKRRRE